MKYAPFSLFKIRHIAFMSVLMLLSCYFMLHAIVGVRGYLRLDDLNVQYASAQNTLHGLEVERGQLDQKVRMMRPETLSLDMFEERARDMLGFTGAHDLVVLSN